MKKFYISLSALLVSVAAFACTGLIATRGATADGSVIVTYAADSHNLFGELYHSPAADHADGEMRAIVEWDTGKPLGEIPQPRHTYSTIGNMNEHGLVITESTWGGREELAGSGMIDYGSLIYITLERARDAREALKIMTDLVNEFGYASEGESFTIADPKEAWILEMIGKGEDNPGAVWVARRIPDGHIAGHANHSRIHRFDLNDPKGETIYSPDVIDFARAKGYFSGNDEDFDFSKAYAIYDGGTLRGCDARVWAFYNKFAEGMDEYLPWATYGKGEILPLSIEPSKKLTADDMKWMMRDHFEGTPFDMTEDIGAGPYKVPYRWRPMEFEVDSVTYSQERAIATQQTGFSLVAQLRAHQPKATTGLLWFGTDDANTCVYLPIFSGVTEVPFQLAHGNGDMNTLSWDSNFWVNNYVANQAYNRYSQMIPDIRRVQSALEEAIDEDVRTTMLAVAGMSDEDAAEEVEDLANRWAEKATKDYKQLGDYLFVKFMDGNIKHEDENGFKRNEYGMPAYPQFGGYDEKYYRSIVTDSGDRLKVNEPEFGNSDD